MNVEIGTEAAQFPKMEYMNEIFVAVWGVINSRLVSKPIFVNLFLD